MQIGLHLWCFPLWNRIYICLHDWINRKVYSKYGRNFYFTKCFVTHDIEKIGSILNVYEYSILVQWSLCAYGQVLPEAHPWGARPGTVPCLRGCNTGWRTLWDSCGRPVSAHYLSLPYQSSFFWFQVEDFSSKYWDFNFFRGESAFIVGWLWVILNFI